MNRQQAPAYTNTSELPMHLPAYAHERLSNGVDVYTISGCPQPLINIEWVFTAGSAFEDKAFAGRACAMLLKSGTVNKTALKINETIDYYGAHIQLACYPETASITLSCLVKYVHILLPLVAEMLTQSTFPQEEVELLKERELQNLELNLTKGSYVADRIINKEVYGAHHPYSNNLCKEIITEVTQNDIIEFYNEFYKLGKCALFVSGDVPENFNTQLQQIFGSLSIRGIRKHHLMPNPFPKQTYNQFIEKENDTNAVQAAIRLAQPFPNKLHPQFSQVMVLNNIFGGYFGSRLMKNIREDKGYTYGIYSYIANNIQTTQWAISSEVGRTDAKATLQEIHYEMEQLRTQLIPADELQMTRNYMMGSILGDLDGSFQLMRRWKNYILNGLTEKYFYEAIHQIKTITPQQLQSLAQQYLVPEKFYTVIVY
jgi:zinc protease